MEVAPSALLLLHDLSTLSNGLIIRHCFICCTLLDRARLESIYSLFIYRTIYIQLHLFSIKEKETHMQQRHDNNLSDTMRRYFATQSSVIDREGNTKSLCHIPLLAKQVRDIFE